MFRYFESLVDPFAPWRETDDPPSRLWPFLLRHAQSFRRVFTWTALLATVIAITEITMIWALGWVVDILTGPPSEVWARHGTALLALVGFVLVLRPSLQILGRLALNQAVFPNVEAQVRWRAHAHVLRQSVGWFENDFAGRIANRVMSAPTSAAEASFQVFDGIAFALAFVIGALVLLGQSDPRLMIPLLGWLVLFGLLMVWTVRAVVPASEAAADARSETTGRLVDAYTNIHAVKLFAHHDRERAYARDSIAKARRTLQSEMRVYSIMDGAMVLLNGLLMVCLVGWAVALWAQGTAGAGSVAAAAALTLQINTMTAWIMWALLTIFRELGVVSEGMGTIAQPITLVDAPGAKPLTLTDGQIEVSGLSHHYGRDAGGLDRVDLRIEPGEKLGLVGRSGAGKSTLVKLLLRFYDAETGVIRIDGQNIAEVTQDSLRGQIGMVQQDSALLHRSVRDNILYGRPEASEAQMIAAAQQAQAHDFILGLRDAAGRSGYDVHVGERGVKLSGGQRQRITLARTILKDAPILLLDEATSALDSEVEAAIQDTLYGMMEGKTVIAIAHRLSTIARMDRIVVLDQGRVIEDGRHDDLLAQGELYATLWARQSGGFLGQGAAQ